MLISHGIGQKPEKIADVDPNGLEKWIG